MLQSFGMKCFMQAMGKAYKIIQNHWLFSNCLFGTGKSHSSKVHVFLFAMKTVFSMFDSNTAPFAGYGCILRTVRGTWNFVWQQATLVQGCTSEAQMNMDVNLCRLPDWADCKSKFPSAPCRTYVASVSSGQYSIPVKAGKRQFTIKKNMHLRTVGIFR